MSLPILPPTNPDQTDFRFTVMKASQYGGLVNFCAWREVLERLLAGRRDCTLPPHPGSLTGTVAHNLLDLVLKNKIQDAAGFDAAWESQIAAKTVKLQADYPWMLSRPPLVDYEKKFRTKLLAEKVWQRRSAGTATTAAQPEGEEAYTIPGLTGRIDLVVRRDDFTAIADYKTGTITGEDGKVKPEFQIQLKLYALLYQRKTRRQVQKLTLVNLAGERYDIPFTQTELESLHQQVLDKLEGLNRQLEASDFEALANLGQDTCKFCQLRPTCSYYWQSDIKSDGDFEGVMKEVKTAADGTLFLRFEVAGKHRFLRGLAGRNSADFVGKEGLLLRVLNSWPPNQVGMTDYYQATVYTALFWSPS